jgi:hypothetical protein
MKGGQVCQPVDPSDCSFVGGDGSLCCRVYDKRNGSWNKYALTARHLFLSDWCDNDNIAGRKWAQMDSDCADEDGYVVEGYQGHDAALLDLDNTSTDITNAFMYESDGLIRGRVTKDGLDYLKSNNETVQKRGRNTCIETGEIKKTQQEMFCKDGNYVGGVVRSTPDQKAGGSGGGVYYEEYNSSKENDLYMVNIATHKPGDGTYDAKGSSANDMANDHGFWFGSDDFSG